jgi:hypothetical protein
MRFKKAILIVLSGLFFLAAVPGCSIGASAQGGGLIISEVVTSNSNSLIDPVQGKPDWIELCNTSNSPISLLDYSIAESSSSRFIFPDAIIEPGEYMVVYCCLALEGVQSDHFCTDFKLSKSGTTLILSSDKSTLQQLRVPALETDISYGIDSEGTYAYFAEPTPGEKNAAQSYAGLAELESDKTVQLTITEVLPRSASSDDPYGWAEIYNAGSGPVGLSDYYITEDLSDPTKARLPEMQLGAGEYAVVRFTGNAGEAEVPFKLSSNETLLAISNNFGAVLDSISWDAAVPSGISAGRADGGDPVYFLTPTPGAANGTDGIDNVKLSAGTAGVQISEVLLSNAYSIIDADGERSPWVELYNPSGSAVSLKGYALSDREDNPLKWMLPEIEVAPGSYITVFLSGKDRKDTELHTNFRIGSGDGKLCLTSMADGTIQTLDLPADRRDNISYGLSPDGQWLYFLQPTPSAPNNTQGFADVALIDAEPSGLRINEVVSVTTAKSGSPDWVELRNGLPNDVNLSGYCLSDTKDDLKKWPLDDISIGANGYAKVDKYQNGDTTGELDISPSGEFLYLTDAAGNVVDRFKSLVSRPGISSGLTGDNTTALFETPTPGAENSGTTIQGYCSPPVFSVSGGCQSAAFPLAITAPNQGADIYYTLDGSTPTTGSTKYTEPITISGTTVVRAITAASGKLNSDEMVATYLFDAPHNLPVVCLSMTKSDLGYVLGGIERDSNRERAGYVEYYEANGKLGVEFPAGFRIAGAGTRDYAQRSINLYLRGGYGRSSVTYPFFEGYNITTFKSLSLRNMGQDTTTRIKDAFIHMAVNGMNVDNMQTKFCAVYINGEYRGLYEFKENQNEDYLASRYGIDPGKVVAVRGNRYNVETGNSDRDIVDLYSFVKRDMDDAGNFEEYKSRADSDYFMDYMIAQTFFYCSDTYNQKFAHTTDNELKWRPLYYDFDLSFSNTSGNWFNFFQQDQYIRGLTESGLGERITDTSLYNGFMRNDEWRLQFLKRYAEVLNSTLSTEHLLAVFDGLVASMKDEMPRSIEKWGSPSSMNKWNDQIAVLRERIQGRREYIIAQLEDFNNGLPGNLKLSGQDFNALFPNG